jgi:hypothetical protein
MSIFAFILGLAKALAWPTVVLLVIFVLRYPIRELLSQITKTANRMRARAGPVELELELERVVVQSVQETKEVNEESIISYPPIVRAPSAFRLNHLLIQDPAAAIEKGYKDIEDLIKTLLASARVEVSAIADLPILARQALDHKLVPAQVVSMADSLSVARVKISNANSQSATGATAYAFMSMYDILQYVIEAYRPNSQ